MLVILLLAALVSGENCLKIPVPEPSYIPEITCIVNITRQYFAKAKHVVYTQHLKDARDNFLLKQLHSMEIVSFNREAKEAVIKPNLAYMIVVDNVPDFLKDDVIRNFLFEINWNPQARFLIIYKSLKMKELRQVFDVFLHYRVYNVVVLNGTNTAELYTYNPFENFACGSYYTRIIQYGKCSEVTVDIYYYKNITGLKNCILRVTAPHLPPWAMDPTKLNKSDILGTEQYIFHLMSKIEQFKYKYDFSYGPEEFSTISQNMSISGTMGRLVLNQSDVMLGGLMLIHSRAKAFAYVSGHLDYFDEIRIIVKKAGLVPAWKDTYLVFPSLVWVLIILALVLYSALVTILLNTKNKGQVFLVLLDSLLLHGSEFRCRQSVKCVVIIWVISAYFLSSFYTTILMSLTTKPSLNYQINDEQDLMNHRLEPCISQVMGTYIISEQNQGEILKDVQVGTDGCVTFKESINTVSKSNRRFTIILYSLFDYNRQVCLNEYRPLSIHSFSKPYARVIYAMYFNKGFPMTERLRKLALRIQEVGLPEKSLKDYNYNQILKCRFRSEMFVARFAIPWYLFSIGCCVSAFVFMVEFASQYHKA